MCSTDGVNKSQPPIQTSHNNLINQTPNSQGSRNSSLNGTLVPLRDFNKLNTSAEDSGIKKMPPEMWDRVFKNLPSRAVFRAMRINREIGAYAKDFLVRGYLKSGSPDDFSELTKLFERASKGSSSPWLNVFYQRVLAGKIRYKSNIFELEKLFNSPQPSNLDAVRKTGLLSDIDLQKLESASSEHIDYLCSKQALLALIDLKLRGVEFNPSAFLEVPSSSFDKGVNFVIGDLVKNGFNTEESLSKIRTLLTSLNTSSLDPKLEGNAAVKCLVAMVRSGLFVNRTEVFCNDKNYTYTPLQSNIKNFEIYNNDMRIRILLAAGADPNQADSEGNTPLLNAMEYHCLALTQTLLKHGANPNLLDESGKHPLTKLLSLGLPPNNDTIPIIDQLFSVGALVNRQDNFGATAMHHAGRWLNHAEVIERLLQKGADVNIRDEDGETIIDYLRKTKDHYFGEVPKNYLPLILKHRPELRELFEKWKNENVEEADLWEDVLNYKMPPINNDINRTHSD